MSISELECLTDKYLKNTITEKEHERLDFLLKNKENADKYRVLIQDDYIIKTESRSFDIEKSFAKIESKLNRQPCKKIFPLPLLYKYAAAAVLVVSLSILFQNLNSNSNINISSGKIVDKQIRLILEDGSQQFLTNTKIDSVKRGNNEVLGISSKGELQYLKTEDEGTTLYNSLHVPYGKTFQLVLVDGSKVFLNAGSSLRYPTNFSNTEQRTVFLTGEAFFEVAKNPNKKFIVRTAAHNIKVLGTEFNVSAYEDNEVIKTTLREGSINVFNGKDYLLLKPNEQSSWNKTKQNFEKRVVDVAQFTAWMNGQKIFKRTAFSEIIRQLERTYDVKIVNTNSKLNNERFTAQFDTESIEQIMAYFSQSYPFKFKRDDKIIIIE